MTCDLSFEGDTVRIALAGALDVVTTPALKGCLAQLETQGRRRVILDLSQLRMLDGRGVVSIVELCKWVRGVGGDVFLRGLQGQPLALFRLLRLDRLLTGPTGLQTFNPLVV
jgi:anti-anti-sigma factor